MRERRLLLKGMGMGIMLCVAIGLMTLCFITRSQPIETEDSSCWERTIVLNDTVGMRWLTDNTGNTMLDLAIIDSIVITQRYYGPCCEQVPAGIWEEKWGF